MTCPFCGGKYNVHPSGYWVMSGKTKMFQITVGAERVYECRWCDVKWPCLPRGVVEVDPPQTEQEEIVEKK